LKGVIDSIDGKAETKAGVVEEVKGGGGGKGKSKVGREWATNPLVKTLSSDVFPLAPSPL
jgi:hypothetical protein